jgi:hypothetical protein
MPAEGGPACGALSRCVGDGARAFAADHWELAPLLTRAADLPGSGFSDLFSGAAVDSLVAERGLRQPFFRLVKDAGPVTAMTRSVVAGNRTITDLADPEKIRVAHADGATIVMQSLHRIWPPVAEFCRQLAAELGHPTQCNAYVTPAGNAQGFAFHHDTHDVFVLQVQGRKHWQIHPPVLRLPTRSQPRSGNDLVAHGQVPVIDTVLEAGDALYLPRGWVHAAATADVPSVHLTVGVLATTCLDILRDVLDTFGPGEEWLRRALPVDFAEAGAGAGAGADQSEAAAGLLEQAAEWLRGLPAGAVAEVVRRRMSKASPPEPLGVMAQAAAVRDLVETTPVRPRRGLDWHLSVADGPTGRITVVLPDKRIELPVAAQRLVAAALAGPSTPRELAGGDPDCDVSDAMVVVRRLLREGVLAPVG